MKTLVSLVALGALPVGSGAAAQSIDAVAQVRELSRANATDSPSQISAPRDKLTSEDQLTPRRTVQQPISQIGASKRTAQGPQSLSTRSDGRPAPVEHIAGKDRCDTALPPEKRTKLCNNVIETRASDFERRDPTELSPEQRLLLAREIQGAGNDVANATQRLGKDAETDDPLELGIAATVLNQNSAGAKAADDNKGPKIDAATQAIINAIVVNQTTPH